VAPSHGENRGSSPLGSANEIKKLIDQRQALSRHCPGGVFGLCQVALGHGERTGGHGCRAAAAGTGIFGAAGAPASLDSHIAVP
jgi:hypothetical protein